MRLQQQEIEFNSLMVRNNTTIARICACFCAGDAFYFNELRQECVLAIWTEFSQYGLSRFRGDSSESTWINQISFHAVTHYLLKYRPQQYQSLCNQYGHGYLARNDSNEDWQLLDDLIEQLNHRERIMLNHFLDDNSYTTIARIENISEDNARKRMSRLIKKLKKLGLK